MRRRQTMHRADEEEHTHVCSPKTPVAPEILRRIKARPATPADIVAWFARMAAAAPTAPTAPATS